MVSINVIESDQIHLRIRLKGIDRAYANAIRRLAMSQVPDDGDRRCGYSRELFRDV